ncbi:MAG TPA: phospholipid carrier-dependent glycosyltransferase [Coleofasciculaceae cyanobacterium]|jgi:dolichyl-phosphate-mannose--protein O-mannosyl transferase
MPAIAPKSPQPKSSSRFSPWFWLGIAAIFLLSLALRFWGLSRFNTLVFDEIYYARFASHFLKGEIIFTGHPPLSTYIIAFGIWLGEKMPWGDHSLKNGLAGLLISPYSYRWLNALTGSFLPLVVAAIAYQLCHRRSYALLAGLLLSADGLFLVESRYALNNVYLLLFGLLGHLFFLIALRAQGGQRWFWLSAAGIGFGASAAIKWNGLGFLLGAGLVWAAGWILHWIRSKATSSETKREQGDRLPISPTPFQNLTQLHIGHIFICFAAIPAAVYYLSWLPYMQIDPSGDDFFTLQAKTFDYHKRVGGVNAHPYCSLWFSWPLMLRPIAYFYKTSNSVNQLPSVVGPPLPQNAGSVIYDVHAMGNPFLWWFSTMAIVLLFGLFAHQIWQWVTVGDQVAASGAGLRDAGFRDAGFNTASWITLYLALNWSANLLPWLEVSRCAFLYHYMESFIFALLGLALLLDRWLQSPLRPRRRMGYAIIALILLAFIFWMPIYLGLPLSPIEIQMRRWLPSWI